MTTVFFILGPILGFVAAYLILLRSKSSTKGIEPELRARISSLESELTSSRLRENQLLSEKASALSTKESIEQQFVSLQAKAAENMAQIESLRTELQLKSNGLAKSNAELEAMKKMLDERQSVYEKQLAESKIMQDKSIADLREAFKALSADALRQNVPEFLSLAQETFGKLQNAAKGDLDKRHEAISGMLKPLEEQLKTYQQRLAQSETTQTLAIGEVKKQLETLGQQSITLAGETERFRMVLKSNQARGRWGEETLRRVVEAAGMSAHCDFIEQITDEDKRPDMIVKLPGDRLVIIDSKVPDLDFVDAMGTADSESRSKLLAAHAAKLKNTIRELAKRDYPKQFPNALDYVVLFLPAESLFSAALEGDRDLIISAAENRIMIATPASLIALLRSVSISWQQFAQTENVKAISEAAQKFYERVATFFSHFEEIRKGLDKANVAFNKAVGSYDKSVKPQGERVLKLGLASGGKELPEILPLIDSSFQ